jgi:hypothetical protein
VNEATVGIVAALSGLVGVGVRELTLRRQRSNKLDAEADLTEATAVDTISQTVKGLLLVMQDQLDRARREVVEVREDMHRQEIRCEREMARCELEIAELRAEVEGLEKRLTAAEQEES